MSDDPTEPATPDAERPAAYTGSGPGKAAPLVPKNVQRLATRTLILILGVALLVFGLQWWRGKRGDLGALVAADTKGSILALRLLDEGSQAVVIRPGGSIVESAGYRPGATDRDAVWSPSGNRAFFVSDRTEGATHIFRWNPGTNSDPEQKTVDASSRGEIAFPRETDVPNADESALVATRGNIEEFFPVDARSLKVLPPTGKEIAVAGGIGETEGSGGAFQAVYNQFGTSFRAARWCRGKSLVAAIMRRGDDEGEILVIQSLLADEKGALPRPVPIIAGERIEMDVSPATGDLAFSVAEFDYPTDEARRDATVNGKIQRPFRHALGVVELSNAAAPKVALVAAANEPNRAFGAPVFSPDGATILVLAGSWADSTFRPAALVSLPAREGGGAAGALIKSGELYEPSWSPDGSKIVYVRRENGKRAIFVSGADGSGEVSITGDKGDFAFPRFSPQR